MGDPLSARLGTSSYPLTGAVIAAVLPGRRALSRRFSRASGSAIMLRRRWPMRSFGRASITALLALVALMAAAPAASAQAEEEPDNIVVLTGRADVRAGETVDNVVI